MGTPRSQNPNRERKLHAHRSRPLAGVRGATHNPAMGSHVFWGLLALLVVVAGCQPAAYPSGGDEGGETAPEVAEQAAPITQASTWEGASRAVQLTEARVGRDPRGVGFTPPEVPASTTLAALEAGPLGHDPQVTAGGHFLLVYNSHRYQIRDKASGALVPDVGGEVAASGDFNTIFAPLWHARDSRGMPNAASINHRLQFAPGEPEICDPEQPTRSNACVQEFYDTRIMWDDLRKRFWIESAARNHLWRCPPGDPCDKEKQSRTQARRYIAVAVSRTEDPRQGFHRYILVNEYADWPKIAVNERYLILAHRTSPHVYVFDADRLAAGNPDHGQVQVAHLDARSFPGARFISTVTHHHAPPGVTFLLGTGGDDQVVPFVLYNPDPQRATRPVVIAGPHVSVGARVGPLGVNPAYRRGFLYWAWDAWAAGHTKEYRDLRIVSLPVRVTHAKPHKVWAASDPQAGYRNVVVGGREPDDAPGDLVDYQMPAMDVNANGDVVVVYSRRGYQTRRPLAPEVRYSILYHGETKARPGVLLRSGSWSGVPDINDNPKAGIDFAYAQVDPTDDLTVWVTHAYSDWSSRWYRQIVGAVRP